MICKMKKSIVVLLLLGMLTAVFAVSSFATRLDDDIHAVWVNEGDIVELGLYPQSLVNDTSTADRLNALSVKWVSFAFPHGENIEKSDWMKYCDVELDGIKYRGVCFSEYKPIFTNSYVVDEIASEQYKNGYIKNVVYWFRYEPIKWTVIKCSTLGFNGKSVVARLTAEKILDCRPFDP